MIRSMKRETHRESQRHVAACIKGLIRTNPMNSHSTWFPKTQGPDFSLLHIDLSVYRQREGT